MITALGQSRRFGAVSVTSGLPLMADIEAAVGNRLVAPNQRSRHHPKMSATVIEFPGARQRDAKPTRKAKGARVPDENIAPLTDFEIAAIESLRAIFHADGAEAFNFAVKRQLFILASLIKRVLGEDRLNELLAAAEWV
jgi:hypothetical protein